MIGWMIEQLSVFGTVEELSLWCLRLCFTLVLWLCLCPDGIRLFLQKGGSHRVLGAVHLMWMVCGAFWLSESRNILVVYDVVLGVLGISTTLTAAKDFPHVHVRNAKGQSGTLSEQAFVTQSEMIEHAFYQFLNLWQALYLHTMAIYGSSLPVWKRWVTLAFVTIPWWLRRRFPVNSFSNNWKLTPEQDATQMEIYLYKIKKCQYLFYKHVILHGINISVALSPKSKRSNQIPRSREWRVFWLALNASYVFEFFLQTLVKRKVLSQPSMLWLQRILMAVSSVSAIEVVLGNVQPGVCLASLVMNLIHRHHDVFNTMLVATVAMSLYHWCSELLA